MKAIVLILFFFFNVADTFDQGDEKNTRYVLIEAPCESTFNALPEYTKKVILTKVFKVEFENAIELVNAEPDLIVRFEVALEKEYPNSRNQIKDILVYMLTTEQEANDLYQRKLKQLENLETGVIKLKIK